MEERDISFRKRGHGIFIRSPFRWIRCEQVQENIFRCTQDPERMNFVFNQNGIEV